jgi:2-dehydropantoate 2-reductase
MENIMNKNMKIVFFGSGAIGQSVGAWIAPEHDNLYFIDQGEVLENLKDLGITHFMQGEENRKIHVNVKVIENLKEIKDADVIIIGVKNFSLHAVSKVIKKHAGDNPIIIGMQNGVENQKILPKYFSKIIYSVIGYNAWFDKPGTIGYQKKGPIIFGTKNNELWDEMTEIADIFNKGVETVVVDHLQDAAHSKLIINLTNSLTTLIGHGVNPVSDGGLFQKLLTNLLYEGVQIAKAAGFKECKIGGMPPWSKLWMGAKLPQFITKGMFNKNAAKMVMSSMAQDIIQRKGHDSELETINGYFVNLAEKKNIDIPYNKTIYNLCKEAFAKDVYKPIDVKDVWKEVEKIL